MLNSAVVSSRAQLYDILVRLRRSQLETNCSYMCSTRALPICLRQGLVRGRRRAEPKSETAGQRKVGANSPVRLVLEHLPKSVRVVEPFGMCESVNKGEHVTTWSSDTERT
jgi:hypothetical protein